MIRHLLIAICLLGPISSHAAGSTTTSRSSVLRAPLTTSGHLSPCRTADNCVLRCVSNSSGSMDCVDGAGAAISVTAGTGAVAESTPFVGSSARVNALHINTDAKAPKIDTYAAIESIYGGNHTVVAVGYAGATGGVFYGHQTATGGLFMAAAAPRCFYYNATTNWNIGGPPSVENRWSVFTCRRNGTTYTARVNGFGSNVVNANVPAPPTAAPVWLGRYGAGTNLNGQLLAVYVFSDARSDDFLTDLETKAFGALAESRNITCDRNSTAWIESSDGKVYAYGDDACRVHPTYGVLVEEARTNYWQQSLDASAWTVLNTPVITTNTTSGPFAVSNSGVAEVDTVNDDNGAAFEAVRSPGVISASPGQVWTASCYVKAGTSTSVLLQIQGLGGTTNQICQYTNLNGTPVAAQHTSTPTCSIATLSSFNGFWRAEITASAFSASTTSVEGYFYPAGTTAAATGTALVAGCQLELGARASSPIVTTTTALQRVADTPLVSSVGLPIASGEVSATVTPLWSNAAGYSAIFDAQGGSGLHCLVDPDEKIYFATGGTVTVGPVRTWATGTSYRVSCRWGGGARYLTRDSVRDTTATGVAMPTALPATMGIGVRWNGGAYWFNGYIRDLEVSR